MMIFFPFFFRTSQAFLSFAAALSQSHVARTRGCNKAPYEVAYGIEICSHLQVWHVAAEATAGAWSPPEPPPCRWRCPGD